MPKRLVLLGAGATAACGGPVTDAILPFGLKNRHNLDINNMICGQIVPFLERFYDFDPSAAVDDFRLPSLTQFMSVIDIAIERKQPFGTDWPLNRVIRLRRATEFLIFAVLSDRLENDNLHKSDLHLRMLKKLYGNVHTPRILSLNYDIIIDNALIKFAAKRNKSALPDYAAHISTRFYSKLPEKSGKLLKLHGSLNMTFCANCNRLAIAMSRSDGFTRKALDKLFRQYDEDNESSVDIDDVYTETADAKPCIRCETPVQPILVSPTHRKDYRNGHLAQIWIEAERQLRYCDEVYFIGYSLPEDDTDVFYLLKRALSDGKQRRFTVVQYMPKGGDKSSRIRARIELAAIKRRYAWLLGNNFEWRTDGFKAWLNTLPNQ